MTRAVTAGYDRLEEADEALEHVSEQVELIDVSVVSNSPAGRSRLQKFDLAPDVRANCEAILERSGFLLVALVPDDSTAEKVIGLLGDVPGSGNAPAAAEASSEEQRIPLVEEQLRVGKRTYVRGGARVRTHVSEVAVQEDVELTAEHASVERRPDGRSLTEEDIAAAGLLKERVIDISEMREEAVVSKQAFVREELVVSKTTEHRVERIDETVRRTEATVEEIRPEAQPALAGAAGESRFERTPAGTGTD